MRQWGAGDGKRKMALWLCALGLGVGIGACSDAVTGSNALDTVSIMDSGTVTAPDTIASADTAAVDVPEDTGGVEDTVVPDAVPDEDIAPDPACEPGEGCFEEPCETAEDCLSEICTMHMGDNVCSKTCDVTCPPGWNCKLITTGSDSQYVCVSKVTHLCFPCDNDLECTSVGSINACVSYGDTGWFCGASCKESEDCPAGYSCSEAQTRDGGTSKQCVADAGVCECSKLAIDTSQSTACLVSNADGVCEGMRTCSEEGLSSCDAATPSMEVCNGIDDNCDGMVDDVPCDDGNPCTEDLCAGEDGCTAKPSPGLDCDDGDDATSKDTCNEEGGCVGTPIVCQDGPCVVSAIPDGDTCVQTFAEAGSLCDDGFSDTKNDVCDGGAMCAGTLYTCPEATVCVPSHTQDGEGCNPVYAEQGTECDDGEAGTSDDVCDGNGFCSGTPFGCPPTSQCVPSYIQDGDNCTPIYAAPGSTCNDGNAGTASDVCDAEGTCAGTPFDCPEQTACVPTYIQDGETCTPIFAAQGVECDDDDLTTKQDQCNGSGSCAGEAFSCPNTDVCTLSYTQDGTGCVATYADQGTACNDQDPATKNDVCNGFGVCAGSEFGCPQPTQCVLEYVKDGDACSPKFAEPGTTCNDGDLTTNNDACDGAGVCQGTPFSCPAPTACTSSYTQDGETCQPNHADPGTACDDGDPTTKTDGCDGNGQCAGTPYDCAGEPTSVCTPNYIQDGVGCVPSHADSGTTCDDGSTGTKNDECNGSGSCSGSPYDCNNEPIDTCIVSYSQDGVGCVPTYAPFGTTCNDGSNGTKNDECNGLGSCSGSPYNCNNQVTNSCTPNYSQDGVGCVPNHAPFGTTCNDGSNGTNNDQCNGAGSCSGSPYNCNNQPTNTCTPSYSQDGVGCVPNYAFGGSPCNDNNNGTKNDQCNGAGSCVGQPINCPGPSVCTPSYTKDGSGCVPNHAFSGAPCNDGNNGTYADQCNGSGSCGGQPCNVSGSTGDEFGTYQTNMVLKYGNGEVLWDMVLLSSPSVAIASQLQSLYLGEIGRQPDQGGLNYWINNDYMVRCQSEATCNPATAKIIVNAAVFAKTKEAILSAIYGPGGEGFKQGVSTLTHCQAKESGL